jgi:hypothetical protein
MSTTTPDPDNLPVDEVQQSSERTERDEVIYRPSGDENDQPGRHEAPGDVGSGGNADQAGDDGGDDTDQDEQPADG